MSSTEPQAESQEQAVDDLVHMVCTGCYPNSHAKAYAICGEASIGPRVYEGALTCVVCAEQFCQWHGPLRMGN